MKGLRMPKKQYLILSLTLFLIYSCASDDSSGPSPATIVGTWSSGELSYHQTDDCLNQGQSIEDFVNTAISNNIEIEAQNTATLACVDESEYETCLANFIELYSNNFDNADSLLFNDLISNTFLYNNTKTWKEYCYVSLLILVSHIFLLLLLL